MIFALCFFGFLGFIIVGGLLFSFFHPGYQSGKDRFVNPPKTDIKDTY